jgi:hypothetical protein
MVCTCMPDAGPRLIQRMRSRAGATHALCRAGYTFDRADNLITSSAQLGPFGQGVTEPVLR